MFGKKLNKNFANLGAEALVQFINPEERSKKYADSPEFSKAMLPLNENFYMLLGAATVYKHAFAYDMTPPSPLVAEPAKFINADTDAPEISTLHRMNYTPYAKELDDKNDIPYSTDERNSLKFLGDDTVLENFIFNKGQGIYLLCERLGLLMEAAQNNPQFAEYFHAEKDLLEAFMGVKVANNFFDPQDFFSQHEHNIRYGLIKSFMRDHQELNADDFKVFGEQKLSEYKLSARKETAEQLMALRNQCWAHLDHKTDYNKSYKAYDKAKTDFENLLKKEMSQSETDSVYAGNLQALLQDLNKDHDLLLQTKKLAKKPASKELLSQQLAYLDEQQKKNVNRQFITDVDKRLFDSVVASTRHQLEQLDPKKAVLSTVEPAIPRNLNGEIVSPTLRAMLDKQNITLTLDNDLNKLGVFYLQLKGNFTPESLILSIRGLLTQEQFKNFSMSEQELKAIYKELKVYQATKYPVEFDKEIENLERNVSQIEVTTKPLDLNTIAEQKSDIVNDKLKAQQEKLEIHKKDAEILSDVAANLGNAEVLKHIGQQYHLNVEIDPNGQKKRLTKLDEIKVKIDETLDVLKAAQEQQKQALRAIFNTVRASIKSIKPTVLNALQDIVNSNVAKRILPENLREIIGAELTVELEKNDLGEKIQRSKFTWPLLRLSAKTVVVEHLAPSDSKQAVKVTLHNISKFLIDRTHELEEKHISSAQPFNFEQLQKQYPNGVISGSEGDISVKLADDYDLDQGGLNPETEKLIFDAAFSYVGKNVTVSTSDEKAALIAYLGLRCNPTVDNIKLNISHLSEQDSKNIEKYADKLLKEASGADDKITSILQQIKRPNQGVLVEEESLGVDNYKANN